MLWPAWPCRSIDRPVGIICQPTHTADSTCGHAVIHGYLSMWKIPAKSISGLVVEYIVAIDVTRARIPADAGCSYSLSSDSSRLVISKVTCSHLILVAGVVCQFTLAGAPPWHTMVLQSVALPRPESSMSNGGAEPSMSASPACDHLTPGASLV